MSSDEDDRIEEEIELIEMIIGVGSLFCLLVLLAAVGAMIIGVATLLRGCA